MDGHLVWPIDPDVDTVSRKKNNKKETGSEQPSRSVQDLSPTPRMATKKIFLQLSFLILLIGRRHQWRSMRLLWKPRKRERRRLPNPHIFLDEDIAAEDKRRLKIGLKANRLEMDPPLSTPTRQTSSRGNNHIAPGDTTEEVPPTSSKQPSNEIMEESVN
ncbi:hypothetical protein R1flu_026498 [Riccia fluitans]|uniref:Uncharacterized protein n=1 Tax=Riccia fluitans TaxID=41844 RepID=A0ABD1XG40_9MARC